MMLIQVNGADLSKLHQEFLDVDLTVDKARNIDSVSTFIFADNSDVNLIQSVIDAHDPSPVVPPLSETEKIRLEMARSNAEMFEIMVSMMGGAM